MFYILSAPCPLPPHTPRQTLWAEALELWVRTRTSFHLTDTPTLKAGHSVVGASSLDSPLASPGTQPLLHKLEKGNGCSSVSSASRASIMLHSRQNLCSISGAWVKIGSPTCQPYSTGVSAAHRDANSLSSLLLTPTSFKTSGNQNFDFMGFEWTHIQIITYYLYLLLSIYVLLLYLFFN